MGTDAAFMGEVDPAGGARLWLLDGAGVRQPVDHVARHSRGSVAWGYQGAGPADAALSILTVATGDPLAAERLHQDFMREVVAKLPVNERFALPRAEVDRWLGRHGFQPAPGPERALPPPASTDAGGPAEGIDGQAAAVAARSRALDERERRLVVREARVDAMALTIGLVPAVDAATSLSAEPVRAQFEALAVDSGDVVEDVARAIGIDPTWAAGVAAGTVTSVDLSHVRQVCEGLGCTPYDLWGPTRARSVAHAYGPDAWPADAEGLLSVDGDSSPSAPPSADWPALAPVPAPTGPAPTPELGLELAL
ncbi:MAG: hypothetical protein QOG43_173 [Actinomycetota bacterium]|jgi:DNA-binding Xre family transcriptional regulator|nr:hypothetical protein [Actinomycetota bacterium]